MENKEKYLFANPLAIESKLEETVEKCFWKKIAIRHDKQRGLYPGFSKCYVCEGIDKDCKFYRV